MIAIAIDVILPMIVVEGLLLAVFHRRTGRGPAPAALWPNLAAGFLLMLAVRLALGDGRADLSAQSAVALVLALALVAHGIDLAARWPRVAPRA